MAMRVSYICTVLRFNYCKGRRLSDLSKTLATEPWRLQRVEQYREGKSVRMSRVDTFLFSAHMNVCGKKHFERLCVFQNRKVE